MIAGVRPVVQGELKPAGSSRLRCRIDQKREVDWQGDFDSGIRRGLANNRLCQRFLQNAPAERVPNKNHPPSLGMRLVKSVIVKKVSGLESGAIDLVADV